MYTYYINSTGCWKYYGDNTTNSIAAIKIMAKVIFIWKIKKHTVKSFKIIYS